MTTANISLNVGSSKKKKKIRTYITLNPEQLEDLKCIVCTKYLSNPPIRLGKDGNYCGDCGDDSNEEQLWNGDFEELASQFEFPCSFEGCEKKLPFERIGHHQKNCNYRQYECPLYSECWKGGHKELKQHILSKHNSCVLKKGTFILKHSETINEIRVLLIEDRYFLVQIHFDIISSEFVFTVDHVGSPAAAGMFKYYLQMVGDKIAKPFCTESKLIMSSNTQAVEEKHQTIFNITDLLAYLKYPTTIECRVFIYNKADFADQTRSTISDDAARSS